MRSDDAPWHTHAITVAQATEDLLLTMGVRYLVLPSIKKVLHMWTIKFGFGALTPQVRETHVVDCRRG